jgi:SAM-dependent methyltransferase
MDIADIVNRRTRPEPWSEGEKIPWNEPEFSKRMLGEHLSQEHDLASHRAVTIDERVRWIHEHVLKGTKSRILDLGCGPGLYTSRLAKLGHRCMGIDFSPASIEFANEHARSESLECVYREADIRKANFGADNDLVMLIFGEFNVFKQTEIEQILLKANAALADSGQLLLEPQSFDAVRKSGLSQPAWGSASSGLFSDDPHIYLREAFWYDADKVTVERYYVIDAKSRNVTRHTQSIQAYTDDEYRSLLGKCGFTDVVFIPTMGRSTEGADGNLLVILAKKQ